MGKYLKNGESGGARQVLGWLVHTEKECVWGVSVGCVCVTGVEESRTQHSEDVRYYKQQ